MPKISSYADGGDIQALDQFVIARAGSNKSILGGKIANRTAFTPTIIGTTIAGAGTYTTQFGQYSRIGNILFFGIVMTWTAHTGTGNLAVAGLPYANAAPMASVIACSWDNLTLTAVGNKVLARIASAATSVTLEEIGSGAAAAIPMDTSASLRLSGFYFWA